MVEPNVSVWVVPLITVVIRIYDAVIRWRERKQPELKLEPKKPKVRKDEAHKPKPTGPKVTKPKRKKRNAKR